MLEDSRVEQIKEHQKRKMFLVFLFPPRIWFGQKEMRLRVTRFALNEEAHGGLEDYDINHWRRFATVFDLNIPLSFGIFLHSLIN